MSRRLLTPITTAAAVLWLLLVGVGAQIGPGPAPNPSAELISDVTCDASGSVVTQKVLKPSSIMPVLAIIGFGPAVGTTILNAYTEAGFSVAILARNQARLDAVATEFAEKGATVKGFSVDLSVPASLPGVLDAIAADLGPIDVAIYNAAYWGAGIYEKSVEEITVGTNVNIVSLHVAFNSLLPKWLEAGKGKFIVTGGGLGNNGAWGAGMGGQFCAGAKAYNRNFAEATDATYKESGIRCIEVQIRSLVYGGATITMEDADPEASAAFRVKLGAAFLTAGTASAEELPGCQVVAEP